MAAQEVKFAVDARDKDAAGVVTSSQCGEGDAPQRAATRLDKSFGPPAASQGRVTVQGKSTEGQVRELAHKWWRGRLQALRCGGEGTTTATC